MKFALTFACLFVFALAQQETAPEAKEPVAVKDLNLVGPTSSPEHMIRDLPADVLRDFPGVCFASTLCRVFKVGESWGLQPFCGKSTCMLAPGGYLVERVEDCGILPKENPKCHVINAEAKNETFPTCCPAFQCEEGAKIEYPTTEELQAAHVALINRQPVEPIDTTTVDANETV